VSAGVTTVVIALVAAFQAIIVALIQRNEKKRKYEREEDEKRSDERFELHKKESAVLMAMVYANSSLSIANGIAIRDGHSNGELKEAIAEAKKARDNYRAFTTDVTATQISKE